MWSKREHPSIEALSNHIGQNVGKLLRIAQNFSLTFFNKNGIVKIEYVLKNGEKRYLQLFICEGESSYHVYFLNKIIDKYCLFNIPEELKEEVFSTKYNICDYDTCYLVLNKQEAKRTEELMSFISPHGDNFIIDESVISAYTKVSDIVAEYTEVKNFQSSSELEKLRPNEKNYYLGLDIRKCLVEKIARCCQKTMFFKENHIVINEFPEEYKIQIVLQNDDSRKIMYCIFDKNMFFMKNVNGVWNKEILPNTIRNVTQCFL